MLTAANEGCALKTALYWDSSDPRGEIENNRNKYKQCT
jgi:hypothetical protein